MIEEEQDDDNKSLSIYGAGHQDFIEEIKEEAKEESPLPIAMPPKKKNYSVRAAVPNKQPGQCDVSWEVLNPVISFVDVEDPSMRRRKASQTRGGITVRVDIPCGIVLASFVPEVSADGWVIIFSAEMEHSRNDPNYTLGHRLWKTGKGVPLAMTKSLQEYWTHVMRRAGVVL